MNRWDATLALFAIAPTERNIEHFTKNLCLEFLIPLFYERQILYASFDYRPDQPPSLGKLLQQRRRNGLACSRHTNSVIGSQLGVTTPPVSQNDDHVEIAGPFEIRLTESQGHGVDFH